MSPSKLDPLLLLIGLALLALSVAMQLVGLRLPEVDPPCAAEPAILCAELPRSGPHLGALLSAPQSSPAQWRRVLWLDMGYLLLYACLLGLSTLREAPAGAHRGYARAVALLFFLGALSDLIENSALLSALAHLDRGEAVPEVLATRARHAALGKFFLLNLGVLGAAAARLGVASWPTRIGLGLAMLASFVGLFSALFVGAVLYALLGVALMCLIAWLGAVGRVWKFRRKSG